MGEDTRRIEDEIRAERAALGRNLQALEYQAKTLTDWRHHYARHAGVAVAVAFGSAFLLGLKTGGGAPRPRARILDTPAQNSRAGFSALAPLRALASSPRARQQVGDTWQTILEALVGVAAVKAVDWIGGVVPGFREEYDARQPSTGPSAARRHSGV